MQLIKLFFQGMPPSLLPSGFFNHCGLLPEADRLSEISGENKGDMVRLVVFGVSFYEVLKSYSQENATVDRTFITGVSPLMLDDMSSGYNISKNITLEPALNAMLGFSVAECESVFRLQGCELSDSVLSDIKVYYNGYRFCSEAGESMFNSDMILYFTNYYAEHKRYPKRIVDSNVKMDYGRLRRLVETFSVSGEKREKLAAILQNEVVISVLEDRFSFEMMYDEKYFISLLFYLGLLTIESEFSNLYVLKIPNIVIKSVFWEFFDHVLKQKFDIDLSSSALKLVVHNLGHEGKLDS